ncbi:hypothetical protein [Haliangium sp.]|uniref:hypothetical protein n=1 Tax=Haliangium sp. TaxID=2663208 RepID=UPI003D0C2818
MSILFAAVTLAVGAAACGGLEPKGDGESCYASSECDDGLTCDFGVNPPVCRSQQTPGTSRVDAAPAPSGPDAAPSGPDAAPNPSGPDAAAEPPDAAAEPPDAAPEPPDAAPEPPDAAPEPPDAAPEPPDAMV